MFKVILLVVALIFSCPAAAYIGPGAGISVLGSIMGILATIFVAIGAILFWPLRKMLKKRRQANSAETAPESDAAVAVNEPTGENAAPLGHDNP